MSKKPMSDEKLLELVAHTGRQVAAFVEGAQQSNHPWMHTQQKMFTNELFSLLYLRYRSSQWNKGRAARGLPEAPSLVFANVEVPQSLRRRGALKALLAWMSQNLTTVPMLEFELVHNVELAHFLERSGWTPLKSDNNFERYYFLQTRPISAPQ